MDKPKENRNKKSLWLWGGILLVAVAAVVAVILLVRGAGQDAVGFKTPYCTLEYPANGWEDSLVLSDKQEDGVYAKTFSAQLGEQTYPLFTVYFGKTDKGNLFGSFTDEEHTPVYITCHPLPEGHTLTADQEMQFYTMQDGINVMTEALAKEKGFTTAN